MTSFDNCSATCRMGLRSWKYQYGNRVFVVFVVFVVYTMNLHLSFIIWRGTFSIVPRAVLRFGVLHSLDASEVDHDRLIFFSDMSFR